MAVNGDYLLYAWGLGTSGQIGDNTATTKSVPTQVGSNSWSIVPQSGSAHMIGSQSDYVAYVFGNNASGQLGTNSAINRSNPTLVRGVNLITNSPTLVDGAWSDINAGLSYTGGISGGALYLWGLNSSGQIGDGTVVNRSVPTLLGVGYSISDASTFNTLTLQKLAVLSLFSPFSNTPANPSTNSVSYRLNTSKTGGQKGNTDMITTSSKAAFNISSYTDYTIEAWVYLTNAPVGDGAPIYTLGLGGGNLYHTLIINSARRISFGRGTGSWAFVQFIETDINVFPVGSWQHVALVIQNLTTKIYLNGTSRVTGTLGAKPTQGGTLHIGSYYDDYNNNGGYLRGYISNLRFVAGTAVYTSNFTVPTSPLTVITNTRLLLSYQTVGTTNLEFDNIYTGSAATYGITTDGNLYAWGLGTTGQNTGYMVPITRSVAIQIGNNYINTNVSSPTLIGAGSWSAVSAGMSSSAAIRNDGMLFIWGRGTEGQIGNNSTVQRSSPVQVGTSSWTQVSLREYHVGAINTIGELYTWGYNNTGQLGLTNINITGDKINRSSPVLVGGAFTVLDISSYNVTMLRFGTSYTTTVVPSLSGSPIAGYFAGLNNYLTTSGVGYVYNTDDFNVEFWVYLTQSQTLNDAVVSSLGDWQIAIVGSVAGSTGQTLGYLPGTSGSYNCQTGVLNLNTWYHCAWVRLSGITKSYVNGVFTGNSLADTNVYNAGNPIKIGTNRNGTDYFNGYISNLRLVFGKAVYTGNFAVPTSVLTANQSASININALTTGETSLLLYTTIDSISGLNSTYYSDISTGSSITGAVTSDGLLYMWGAGTNGELGNNSLVSRSSPVQVGPVGIGASNTSYTSVNTGYFYSGAIGTNGLLYMWGFNTAQTNFPSIWYNATARSNPTQIDGLYATTAAATRVPIRSGNSSWTQVEAGNSFSSGLYYKTAGVNGLLYTWGLNSIGQLGLNDTINRSSPVQIGQNTFLTTTVGASNTGVIGKAT
jgi:alpha-tubulin suppressor-like RCC1 family protein